MKYAETGTEGEEDVAKDKWRIKRQNVEKKNKKNKYPKEESYQDTEQEVTFKLISEKKNKSMDE